MYHKDKFIAPILHEEMKAMQVKSNGKVEHSSNSHDDQVFSYLMALYVWYDGKNLAERYHIMKTTIKTDTSEDLEELDIEDQLESTEKVDIESISYDPNSEVAQQLAFIEANSKIITTEDLKNQEYYETIKAREFILSNNKSARENYCKENGLDPQMYENNTMNTFVMLPDSIFTEESYDMDEDDGYNKHSYLAGNLADMWDKI